MKTNEKDIAEEKKGESDKNKNDGTVCEKRRKEGSQTKWEEGDDDGATRCVGPDKTLGEEIL